MSFKYTQSTITDFYENAGGYYGLISFNTYLGEEKFVYLVTETEKRRILLGIFLNHS